MFTQNQTRQLYVVKNVVDNEANLVNPGDIMFHGTFGQPDFYFNYVSTDGKIQRSDMIDGGMDYSVSPAIFTAADTQKRTSKAYVVTLDTNLLTNNQRLINGQDYMLNIRIQQYYFKSDLYDAWKHGVVHGAGNMEPKKFYAMMALSLFGNFSREPWPILKFGVTTSTIDDNYTVSGDQNITWINKNTKIDDLTGTYTALIIDEEPQDWHLGKMEQEPVIYNVACDYIIASGEQMIWGEAKEAEGKLEIEDGKKIADMEWFYHGERGDIYREYAYPNNFDNVALVDPTKKYDAIDVHFYWQGANHAVQKSEKDITLVMDTTLGITNDVKTAFGIN
jgi:hypothetical protein